MSREKVPLELGKKLLANLDNSPKLKSLPSNYDRTLTKARKVRNVKKNVARPFLSVRIDGPRGGVNWAFFNF